MSKPRKASTDINLLVKGALGVALVEVSNSAAGAGDAELIILEGLGDAVKSSKKKCTFSSIWAHPPIDPKPYFRKPLGQRLPTRLRSLRCCFLIGGTGLLE
jgi:hypothetical protein